MDHPSQSAAAQAGARVEHVHLSPQTQIDRMQMQLEEAESKIRQLEERVQLLESR